MECEDNYSGVRDDTDAWRSENELTQGYWDEDMKDYVTFKVVNKVRGQAKVLRLRCDKGTEE